ncbi:MAG TPA: hypothetical protein VHX88_16510 [Solirubrobacteraceae bacterium]|nr:hypothetical protein [Solirubrobacteraceae bacterium]
MNATSELTGRLPAVRGVRERLRVSPAIAARWPLERVLFAIAGTLTLFSVIMTAAVSPWWLVLTGYVGVNQWIYVVRGFCPSSYLLRRGCGLRSVIWPNPDGADSTQDGA